MPYGIINGARIYYRMKGQGVPLLLIHPPLLNSAVFNYQIESLSDQFQVIVMDIRGHGKSEHSHAPITYSLIAEDIKQLLNLLKLERVVLCGYSTGGGIALEAMLNYPNRFYGGILISTMSEVSDWWLRSRLLAAIGLTKGKARRILSLAISFGNADMKETFRNLYHGAIQGSVQNMKQYYLASYSYNCTNNLKYLDLPQLLVYGAKDRGFHRYANMLKEELAQSTLVFLNDESHQLPTKAPLKLNPLISAWSSQWSQEEVMGQEWLPMIQQLQVGKQIELVD